MNGVSGQIPSFFEWLRDQRLISMDQLRVTNDGFCMIAKSLSSILLSRGIDSVPDREGKTMACRHFFDDWFFYGVRTQGSQVYGLLKMREQEDDQKRGIYADGDTPGVTISFIAFDTDAMKRCLEHPTAASRQDLGMEINRVAAYQKQNHDPQLKAYFIRPQAEAAYLIAEEYTALLASFARDGVLAVPEAYRDLYRKRYQGARYARVPDFLEEYNRRADTVICDHQNIFIKDAGNLSRYEKLALLATHTGNVSVHSFAAEVRYHAMFLEDLAKIRLPFVGSPYASAVRADMSIGDKEFQGPAPYYQLSGRLVQEQKEYHPDQY